MEVAGQNTYHRGWLRFAQSVVSVAGVLDDQTEAKLVHAFAVVPRNHFIANSLQVRALEDVALPLSHGQMVPRPSLIARMLGLLGIRSGMRVLEIGCGSGYTSAIISEMGAHTFAVEKVGLLAQQTRKLLDRLGYQDVLINRGDGRRGWAEHAPYDAILVSTPMQEIDQELLLQLRTPGGRLLAPIGDAQNQILKLWENNATGLACYTLEGCQI